MGMTLTRRLEIGDAFRILMKISWKTSIQTREADEKIAADLRLLGCEDGMGMCQTQNCVLLLYFLLKKLS